MQVLTHQLHANAHKAAGHSKVGVLSSGTPAPMILFEFLGAVLPHVIATLDQIILEQMIASPGDASIVGLALGASRLLHPGDDSGIGCQPPNRGLLFRRTQLRTHPRRQHDARALHRGHHGGRGLGQK